MGELLTTHRVSMQGSFNCLLNPKASIRENQGSEELQLLTGRSQWGTKGGNCNKPRVCVSCPKHHSHFHSLRSVSFKTNQIVICSPQGYPLPKERGYRGGVEWVLKCEFPRYFSFGTVILSLWVICHPFGRSTNPFTGVT